VSSLRPRPRSSLPHPYYSLLLVFLLSLIRINPCSSYSFSRSSALILAHRIRSPAHPHLCLLIVFVLSLIRINPCSSYSFSRSSVVIIAHRSVSPAHPQKLSLIIRNHQLIISNIKLLIIN